MTLHLNQNQIVPSVKTLHDMVKDTLSAKYTCAVIPDRFTLSFSQPKQCVLIKKSIIIGVGVFVNEKANSIDVDGIVPNQILDRVVFGNYVTRLLLLPNFKKMEKEVADLLKAKLQ
jgi:hypothetical protein